MLKRPIFSELKRRVREPRKFIQALLGPRQVGKTTLALQLEEDLGIPTHFISADTATLQDLAWLEENWERAREKTLSAQEALLVIDEVQKIPHWSSVIKKRWDEDTRKKIPLKVILLGSSPWLMQQVLTESLAGRFEILPVTHWKFSEMIEGFGWDLDSFLYFGGYPGAASFANPKDPSRWRNYINDSLIETTISRDILLMTQVNKPALLRRLFQLGCLYSGQTLSYQKMLGQLQDAGNTTTLAHYLELLGGAGMITGIHKYTPQPVRSRHSSPKLQVLNTALMSAQSERSFEEAKKDLPFWGRLTESAIGAYLVNAIRGTPIKLFYWREGNKEVDFVLQKGESLVAIEVKSGVRTGKVSGMDAFAKRYQPTRLLLVGKEGVSIEAFLKTSVYNWFSTGHFSDS